MSVHTFNYWTSRAELTWEKDQPFAADSGPLWPGLIRGRWRSGATGALLDGSCIFAAAFAADSRPDPEERAARWGLLFSSLVIHDPMAAAECLSRVAEALWLADCRRSTLQATHFISETEPKNLDGMESRICAGPVHIFCARRPAKICTKCYRPKAKRSMLKRPDSLWQVRNNTRNVCTTPQKKCALSVHGTHFVHTVTLTVHNGAHLKLTLKIDQKCWSKIQA